MLQRDSAGMVAGPLCSRPSSQVVEQGHESKVHVELLVAMEKREARVVRSKADFHLLVSADHYDIFHYAPQRFPRNSSELEGVTMKMDGMNIVAGVAHTNAIALALAEMIGSHHRVAGKHLVVDRPPVKAVLRGILFRKGHFNQFIR